MRLFFIIFLLCITSLGFSRGVHAQKIENQIDSIKNRVASRVAELNLVEKRGIVGKVTDVSGNEITVTDASGNTRFIDVDELTKFSSDDDNFGISDIEKGDGLGVTGLYNKDSRRILARFVNTLTVPELITGVIFEINSDDFTLKIMDDEGREHEASIETITKSFAYSDDDLERSGFSKAQIGENAVVVGFKDPKNKDILTASKFIHFPGLPSNPNIIIPQEALKAQDEVVPSTGSGKKLTPLE